MIYKQIVENRFAEKAKNDSNSQDLANGLNILSKTVFGEINRFIFELLQRITEKKEDVFLIKFLINYSHSSLPKTRQIL